MLGYISVFMVLVFFVVQLGAYDLTEKDNRFLDVFEERLFDIIDEKDSVTPEKVAWLLENILEKDLSERNRTLVEIILDDLQYAYYIWEYSDETQTSEDCYEDEFFDEEDQVCYFDDEEYDYEQEEDFLDQEVDLSHWEEGEDNSEIQARYSIKDDKITLVEGTTNQRYENAWNTFAKIIPLSVRGDLIEYQVVDDPNSDTAAHVEQNSEDNTKWNLSINMDSVYEWGDEISKEGIATLIHEFAHVLTLNKSQVRYYPITGNEALLERFSENCQTNLLQEWCLSEDAYLDDFIDTFWTDAELLKKVREDGEDVYTGNEDNFITDYAATNPGEDIAESFTYFVLNKKPTGKTIAYNKLNFFYNYKELDNLRKQIRTRLESVSQ